ncbi:uncharacterized protein PITG_18900 [Phytophthora infestans T30-4]|uniref:Secreted RxLR effector peptide protein n=1 Tax=Phytophthora infestans (strain T30-4) TaxID=403677 RepID=D0NZQ2_PHYIT|nr:uncharacterized protein PITG_18900 [Phytophthora infestans T30-4]EEY69617.1 hypothetical protein PITG_18900 [Phytophthora infestans T30-4]|eukprot:XP_002997178.1 hypothetical protein PITG_18900 [Phytophthora infestans T30-4]
MGAAQLLLSILVQLCLYPTWPVLAKEVFTGKATTYGLEPALGETEARVWHRTASIPRILGR